MDILLVYPPGQELSYQMSLPCLAAYLREKGHSVKIYDTTVERSSFSEIMACAKATNAKAIGVSIPFTPYIYNGVKLFKMLREEFPNTLLLCGGVHPTLSPEDIVEHCDVVVIGEGEITTDEILQKHFAGKDYHDTKGIAYFKDGKMHLTEPRELIKEFDKLPPPAWDMCPVEKYKYFLESSTEKAMPLAASRGCPYNCNFCSNWVLSHRTVRFRNIDDVIQEIKGYIEKYDVHAFSFRDEVFTINKKRVFEFCNKLKENNLKIHWVCNARVDIITEKDEDMLKLMKETGCWMISVGVESGDVKVLTDIEKHITLSEVKRAISLIQKHGILVYCTMILGHLTDTPQTVANSINFIHEANPDATGFGIATPYPGTVLRSSAIAQGCELEKDWEKYSPMRVTYVPPGLKGWDIQQMQKVANLSFYGRDPRRLKLRIAENRRWVLVNTPGLAFEYIKARLGLPLNLKKIPWWYSWTEAMRNFKLPKLIPQ